MKAIINSLTGPARYALALTLLAALFLLAAPSASAWAAAACQNQGNGSACTMASGGAGECCRGYCYGAGACDIAPGTCTNSSSYDIAPVPADGGIVSLIVNGIINIVAPISESIFDRIVGNTGFRNAVTAAATIYIAIYGILFTFGMVQITVSDLVMRLVKLGIIRMLLEPNSYTYFDQVVVTFFQRGTDDIINAVSAIAVGGQYLGGSPFGVLDNTIIEVVSSKMSITMIALLCTGPYGFIIGMLLIMSLASFLKGLINAMWIYVMALVLRYFLFGLAPMFIACVLFSRTRHLFEGWLNQVVNTCLQPIFLFTFFAFFCNLIGACLAQILSHPVCWTEWAEPVRGTPFAEQFWRFAITDCRTGQWVPFDGRWDFSGPVGVNCQQMVSPIDIMLPITLWVLADLAGRFSHIAVEIAKDISSASTNLSMSAMPGGGGGGGGGGKKKGVPPPPPPKKNIGPNMSGSKMVTKRKKVK